MKHPSRGSFAAVCALLASGAMAQAPCGYSLAPTPSWFIVSAFNSVPGNDVRQVQHVKLSDNPLGTWTTALTVGGLPPASPIAILGGNSTSVGVAIGETDPCNSTFLIRGEARNLNSAEDDTHLTLSPDGLWALVERPSGVWRSGRAAVATVFPAPVKVTGFGAGGSYTPALGKVKGVWQCFYSSGGNIVMQPIDLVNATLTGTATIVSLPAQPGAIAFAPTPVIGGDGDVEALWCSDLLVPKTGPHTGDADPVWANDLDPTTPAVVQEKNSEYQCCGGLMGGFMNFSHDILPTWHIMHGEGAWLLGDDEVPGGTLNLNTGAINCNQGSLVSTVFIALATTTPPLKVGTLLGRLGLNPATMVPFPLTQFSTTSVEGLAATTVPIPNDPFLKGAKFALQAIVSNLGRGTHVFTNTAWLHIR